MRKRAGTEFTRQRTLTDTHAAPRSANGFERSNTAMRIHSSGRHATPVRPHQTPVQRTLSNRRPVKKEKDELSRRGDRVPDTERRYIRGSSRRALHPKKSSETAKSTPVNSRATTPKVVPRAEPLVDLPPPESAVQGGGPGTPRGMQRYDSLQNDQSIFRRSASLLGTRRSSASGHLAFGRDDVDEGEYLQDMRWGQYLNSESPGNSLLCRRASLIKCKRLRMRGIAHDMADKVRGYIRIHATPSRALHDDAPGQAVMEYSESANMATLAGVNSSTSACHYEKIFGPKAPQEDLFETIGRPAVAELFEGYNASVVVLGPAEAGSTATFMGRPSRQKNASAATLQNVERPTIDSPGLVSRICEAVYTTIAAKQRVSLAEPGLRTHYRVEVAYSEIHGTSLRDLFAEDSKPLTACRVRVHPILGPQLAGARPRIVETYSECSVLLDKAFHQQAARWASEAADENASHTYVRLTLYQLQYQEGKETTTVSTIHMVRVADREPQPATPLHEAMLKASAAVSAKRGQDKEKDASTRSPLQCVMDAVVARGNRYDVESVVAAPYGATILTEILADSFGGNCRSTFVGCVMTHPTNIRGCKDTLEFVAKARTVINPTAINEDCIAGVTADLRKTVMLMHADRMRLRTSATDDAALVELREDIATAESAAQALSNFSQELHRKWIREYRSLQTQVQQLEGELAILQLKTGRGGSMSCIRAEYARSDGSATESDTESASQVAGPWSAEAASSVRIKQAAARVASPEAIEGSVARQRKRLNSIGNFSKASLKLDVKFDEVLEEMKCAPSPLAASSPKFASPRGDTAREEQVFRKKFEIALLALQREASRMRKKGGKLVQDNLQLNLALESLSRRCMNEEASVRQLQDTNQRLRMALNELQPGAGLPDVAPDGAGMVGSPLRRPSYRIMQAEAEEAQQLRAEVSVLRRCISERDSTWQNTLDEVRTRLVRVNFDYPDEARDAVVELIGLCNGTVLSQMASTDDLTPQIPS